MHGVKVEASRCISFGEACGNSLKGMGAWGMGAQESEAISSLWVAHAFRQKLTCISDGGGDLGPDDIHRGVQGIGCRSCDWAQGV